MSHENAVFQEVKRAASLVDYIEARSGGKVARSGASMFVNPAPCCGHNDCFSLFSPNKDGAQDAYKCHSCGAKGDVFSFATGVLGMEAGQALRDVAQFAGVPLTERDRPLVVREKSLAEFIAEKCVAGRAQAVEYLTKQRGISEEVAARAAAKGAVGFNDYRSAKVAEGQPGYGGPAFASIVRSLNPGHVMAVDLRYLDPSLNGGVKTMSQGEKQGYGWTSDIKALARAKTVFFCESAINALSIECAGLPASAAFALRGTGNAANIPLDWMRGKMAVVVPDNDAPGPDGFCAGMRAAWVLHERLTALDVACLFVNTSEWGDSDEVNDVNDLLKSRGPGDVKVALGHLEPWAIPGLWGTAQPGKKRIFLPAHHWAAYAGFRVQPDFTRHFAEQAKKNPETGEIESVPQWKDVAGFRIASISRVTIQSATATMSGDEDTMPRTLFSLSVQVARHGPELVRKVVDDDHLHNVEVWKKFGPVWDANRFSRLVNILENAADLGARKAANFVGLCWKEGRLVVNEGPDCYFHEPEKQCPYSNLTFPSGKPADGLRVIQAYQATFGGNAATMLLVWALGGHLKAFLGAWPHMVLQADKGAGKSTLIKRLERSIGFTMMSGQSTQTDFRLLTSVSHTSQPVGWEEISARRQQVIDAAVALLQESYQYTVTRRGADMTEFLLSAPVLLAGEDVPVVSLTGKIVRASLREKGALMPDELPRFPVRQWLAWLAGLDAVKVRSMMAETKGYLLQQSRASGADNGAVRMVGNYAALLLAWRLLAEFVGLPQEAGDFRRDLLREMNGHVAESSADRHPWVWIMERFAGELAAGRYQAPVAFKKVAGEDGAEEQCLCVRTSDVMHHMATSSNLRDFYNGLPVKSDRVFKKQMRDAGVVIGETECTVGANMNRRYSRMAAISVAGLERFGVLLPSVDAGF